MDHMNPSHPKTFDEVIKRGFPHDELESLHAAHRQRTSGRTLVRASPLKAADVAVAPFIREDQASFTAAKQAAFRNAVTSLVNDGSYLQLVQNHMDMSHNMHGSMGETGLYRFLAWHRRYLVEFERALERADLALRPTASDRFGIPYWRWQDPFPAWLEGFLPATDPNTGMPVPARTETPPSYKPNAADIDIIVNQFAIQVTGLTGENDYTKFTYGVEGWGRRPDRSDLPAHNHVHAWVGGIMNNTSTSPTDPVFWLHHAEVDRLWQVWRQSNAAPQPNLAGSDLVMDPWAESYNDLLNIVALGYDYDSLTL